MFADLENGLRFVSNTDHQLQNGIGIAKGKLMNFLNGNLSEAHFNKNPQGMRHHRVESMSIPGNKSVENIDLI